MVSVYLLSVDRRQAAIVSCVGMPTTSPVASVLW